jgi:N-methylhydantoinase A/oxoprolinase/acetone carboxylase beta subunit
LAAASPAGCRRAGDTVAEVRVGVDTGGTFTDVVRADGSIAKVPSTPDDPAAAVTAAVAGTPVDLLAHGTTVATNALLERQLGAVALITNAGFEDVIEIARQDRPSLYDQWADRPAPLVGRARRIGIHGRLGPDGAELEPLCLEDLPPVPADVDVCAVSLLHSDLAPRHEQEVAARLRARGHDVTCSHEVAPEFREYERTVTTVVNAALRPRCRDYTTRVGGLAPAVQVMTSAGGLVDASFGAERPAALLLSGPAGGVRAAAAVAATAGFDGAVSFDMGGTSTDVCLVLGGVPEPAPSLVVGGYPVRLPALDVHTIGAGGGSIAWLDAGGALRVGPRSAGAVPGPACYRRGGTAPTVTDADLVLARIPAGHPLPGLGHLDVAAAARALAAAGIDAADVVDVVDAAMVEAVRAVTVARGVDPGELALVAFGGAGPLHACAVAGALGMQAVVVPARAGVLSAVGLLTAPVQRDVVRSWPTPLDHAGLTEALDTLGDEAAALVAASVGDIAGGRGGDERGEVVARSIAGQAGVEVRVGVDCRYAGQSHEITVPSVDEFPAEHALRNGYRRDGHPVEVIALRASARVASPVSTADLPVVARDAVRGPAVLAEPDCTLWIPPGWHAVPAAGGALVLRRAGAR